MATPAKKPETTNKPETVKKEDAIMNNETNNLPEVQTNAISIEKVLKIFSSFDRGRNDGAEDAKKWLLIEENQQALADVSLEYFAASSLYEAARNKGLSTYLEYAKNNALCLAHNKILTSGGMIETPYDGFMESLRSTFDLTVAFEGSKISVFVPEDGLTKDIAKALQIGCKENELTLTRRSRMGKLPDKTGSFIVFELIIPQSDPFADLFEDDKTETDDENK